MANEIIDAGNGNPDIQVDIGNGRMVSMQAVQHIYNEITGRSEELARPYTINHSIGFDDLRQLNIKICQLYEQYNIVSRNCSVALFHVDDQKQVFSSFERFEMFDSTTLSPVENVRFEYHFLIVLPQVNKPQSYTIEINIQSRAAIAKRVRSESHFPPDMFEYFASTTARMEITYVDYTVARNFQVAIDGWFKALPVLVGLSMLRPLKAFVPHYAFLFRFASTLTFLLVCSFAYSTTFWSAGATIVNLYSAALITFGGMFVLSIVSGKLGAMAANAIRRIQSTSYLNLTRGDKIALDELGAANRMGWLKAGAAVIVAVVVNVFSSWLAIRLGLGA